MVSDQTRILVVDGANEIATALAEILENESYRIDTVWRGADALVNGEQTTYDLVLLDLEVEDFDGVELIRRVREVWPDTAIIVTTQRPTVASAIAAVRHEIHDYVIRPFASDELKRAVVQGVAKTRRARRDKRLIIRLKDLIQLVDGEESAGTDYDGSSTSSSSSSEMQGKGMLQARDIIIDRHRRRVRRNGKWVSLTPTEFNLLTYLVSRAGEVQGYRKLVSEVQGYEADEWEAKNLIKYYIHCLRKKLEPRPGEPTYIVNVRGVGYLFASK
ncbi:MAG: response regulator transcription factor [Anaerolineae bacterium]